jgi:hypothetical protein
VRSLDAIPTAPRPSSNVVPLNLAVWDNGSGWDRSTGNHGWNHENFMAESFGTSGNLGNL